nr:10761_t:CDS:2 [Entrophospora candida]
MLRFGNKNKNKSSSDGYNSYGFSGDEIYIKDEITIIEKLKNDGIEVLDVGCGFATWICDIALDYPLLEFVEIDITPLFPTQGKFYEKDLLDILPFADNSFILVDREMVEYFDTGAHKRVIYWEHYLKEIDSKV